MKQSKIYILMLLAGLLSFSSCEEGEEAIRTNGQTVSMEIPIRVRNMDQAGDGTVTRSEKGGIEWTFGEVDPVTRSTASDAEKKINKLYIVQFEGTAATSKAVAQSEDITVTGDTQNNVTFD